MSARRRLCCWAALLAQFLAVPGPALAQFNGNFAIERHVLDVENFLDWRAYQPPSSWRIRAYARPNRMQVSVGSISEERFYMAHEIWLEKELGDYAAVLYHQREEGLFRPDPIYQEGELRFGAGGWYASILGFPQHEKTNGAQGMALAWGKRTDDVYVQYARLEQFALYNKEHEGPERFDPAPVLHRLQVRHAVPDRWAIELNMRQEDRTRLALPDAGLISTYAGHKTDAAFDWFVSNRLTLGLMGSSNVERREQVPTSVDATDPELRQRLAWSWWEVYGAWSFPAGNQVTVAVNDAQLSNRIRADQPEERFRHRLTTTQLYVLWEHPRGPWFRWMFTFQAGRVFLLQDPASATSRHDDGTSTQVKAGVGFALIREADYRLWFHTTWDGDAFTQRQWDGGNLQLQLFF